MVTSSAWRGTKIIATLGPATDAPDVLDSMVAAGVDVARLNCSHGVAADHIRRAAAIRAAAARAGRTVAVLVDIQGPKLRVGRPEVPWELTEGAEVRLAPETSAHAPTDVTVCFDLADVGAEAGDRVLLDDGRIELAVTVSEGSFVYATVVTGGTLTARKGVNFPDSTVQIPALSAKDVADLAMADAIDADWVAVSFVSCADDIDQVRRKLPSEVGIVAKIERPVAVERFDEIALAADAVMIARGDLGVETPLWDLGVLQKDLMARARSFGVPVITATEMLESMTTGSRPTRAEVADVTNAVLDGTDALMLSGETAAGVDPANAVDIMARIAFAAEASSYHRLLDGAGRYLGNEHPATAALVTAAEGLAQDLHLDAIVVFTESGRTARLVSETRPAVPVIGFAHDTSVRRRLALYWGVQPMELPRQESVDAMLNGAADRIVEARHLPRGARVVFVAGPPNQTGSANFVILRTL